MADNRLRIVGGTEANAHLHASTPEDVHREARRRLVRARMDAPRIRAMATGCDPSSEARYIDLQIELVARSLSALRPVPTDFSDDMYWPV